MKRKRDSNIELLRFFSMIMIIIFHIYDHCIYGQLNYGSVNLFRAPFFYKKLLVLAGISPFGKAGNAIFIMISGYYMVSRNYEINVGKIAKKLILQQGYAAIILTIGFTIINRTIDSYAGPLFGINTFNELSWFVGYYIIIIICAYLFLNQYLIKIDKEKYISILLCFFLVSQFSWSGAILDGLSNGVRTVVTGLFLYSLGGYVSKYKPFKHLSLYTLMTILVLVYTLIFLSSYNITMGDIKSYNGEGEFYQSIVQYADYNIIPIVLGATIFEIFSRLKLPSNNVINFLGESTFMVYLIHDNAGVYSLWNSQDWITMLYYHPWQYVIKHIMVAVVTFFIGVVIYFIYKFLYVLCSKMTRIVGRQ